MANIKDILIYIFLTYPNKNQLSKARLVKIMYLIDWKYSIQYEKQMTNIAWYYNHYGPYVDDILQIIENDDRFTVISTINFFGERKNIIKLVSEDAIVHIPNQEKEIIDFVINKTAGLSWSDFINLVYSTHPIVTNPRYSFLDLVKSASEYRLIQQNER